MTILEFRLITVSITCLLNLVNVLITSLKINALLKLCVYHILKVLDFGTYKANQFGHQFSILIPELFNISMIIFTLPSKFIVRYQKNCMVTCHCMT